MADPTVFLDGPFFGVPRGVLPVENIIVSLADESTVLHLLDPLRANAQSFKEGEKENVGILGRF